VSGWLHRIGEAIGQTVQDIHDGLMSALDHWFA
jgi:hypothetical protein